MANADCIVIQGSNMAECHPVGFQWVTEAKARGATIVHVDPRFTRTSAIAHRHVPIRVGSDIVLLGALINHVLTNELYFDEYVRAFTNAATIVCEDFVDAEDLDGLFSGFDPATRTYDRTTWAYAAADGSGRPAQPGEPTEQDPTLQHPRCVFQVLKRHYARYTPQLVAEVCGIAPDDFASLARTITENSNRERTTCFAYAVGWTQHAQGAQYIRTAAILQLLLGNMGRPGGGIMALRGHASIQGSTDIPTLFNLLPGYLPMPVVGTHDTLRDYLDTVGRHEQKSFWANADAYTVSLLKAWWGDVATAENDYAYDYLPMLNGPHGTYQTVQRMLRDEIDGYFIIGQNPAVGSANGRMQRLGMSHLKWLVVRDYSMIESATWWKDGPEIESGELRTDEIDTEVFFLPAANHMEKSGTFTQTQRLVQWREQAAPPPGDAQSELHFYFELGRRIRERLRDSDDPRDRPLLDLTWDYPVDAHGEPDPEAVLREINGFVVSGERAGEPVRNFGEYRADGTTAGGCWIYAGVYADGVNQANRRPASADHDAMASNWAWAWPANRRILYNRASADAKGVPWSERKKLVWWDAEAGRWTGPDVPDFPVDRAPDAPGDEIAHGPASLAGTDAFIMQPDGKAWLFAPTGVVDGPLPTHYEAQESPVPNPVYGQQHPPTQVPLSDTENPLAPSSGAPGSDVYPYAFTTYRLTEHHTAGGMSRWLPYLAELQPEPFAEISPELAAERGLEPYGWATIVSPRAAIEVRLLVTDRVRPIRLAGRTVHQIGLPYHWGVGGDAVVTGDSANDLIGVTMDPNVFIQDSKTGACDILPGRRPRGAALAQLVEDYRRRAGVVIAAEPADSASPDPNAETGSAHSTALRAEQQHQSPATTHREEDR